MDFAALLFWANNLTRERMFGWAGDWSSTGCILAGAGRMQRAFDTIDDLQVQLSFIIKKRCMSREASAVAGEYLSKYETDARSETMRAANKPAHSRPAK